LDNTKQDSILLTSGTNEVEIVEFSINDTIMGINVIKVKEIINPLVPVKIPNAHPCLEGIIQLRQEIIPVVDLGKFLGFKPSANPKQDKFIVSEFNQAKYAFHVHTVSRIHRISWGQIEKPADITQTDQSNLIGIIKLDSKMILLLDFEKIMVDIAPSLANQSAAVKAMGNRSISSKNIMIAEDSPMLRKLLQEYLPQIGYPNLSFYSDGEQALNSLLKIAEEHGNDFSKVVNILITDIEMPKMDGHYLTKTIKNHPILKDLPVVIFSSLITDDLRHKGVSVGADEQVSKPEYEQLSHIIDRLIL
jgi:two-component system chemotaxis response regulator CheV